MSSNVDDGTLRELYLWPIQHAVRAGSGHIKCSYQRVDNSYECQNSYWHNRALKGEIGFQGFVVSDGGALAETGYERLGHSGPEMAAAEGRA